ncbi:MAG: YkvA family protein [Syntrophales bacterium]|nr:YkvA family protein [Syntrophales bacterium]
MLLFEKLKSVGRDLKQELRVYQLVLKDSRTPQAAKLILGMAVGYALMPFDLIPDFIPVIGHLDDAVIVPLLVILALKMIPGEIIEDCRTRVRDGQINHSS